MYIYTCIDIHIHMDHIPLEDYELPILNCNECHNDTTHCSLIYINPEGIFNYFGGKAKSKRYKNTHICFHCLFTSPFSPV